VTDPLRAQLERGLRDMARVLSRDPDANVDRWSRELIELEALIATSVSIERMADQSELS
jgi:hypothetical protein